MTLYYQISERMLPITWEEYLVSYFILLTQKKWLVYPISSLSQLMVDESAVIRKGHGLDMLHEDTAKKFEDGVIGEFYCQESGGRCSAESQHGVAEWVKSRVGDENKYLSVLSRSAFSSLPILK